MRIRLCQKRDLGIKKTKSRFFLFYLIGFDDLQHLYYKTIRKNRLCKYHKVN